ncbi:hypothetical protein BTHE_1879 [Bifidobacterium thermophilum]|nr:hypothetical protein BTHE_1879 [Bifidobacterium thermophilum]
MSEPRRILSPVTITGKHPLYAPREWQRKRGREPSSVPPSQMSERNKSSDGTNPSQCRTVDPPPTLRQ